MSFYPFKLGQTSVCACLLARVVIANLRIIKRKETIETPRHGRSNCWAQKKTCTDKGHAAKGGRAQAGEPRTGSPKAR
jgi:hypothetical protein